MLSSRNFEKRREIFWLLVKFAHVKISLECSPTLLKNQNFQKTRSSLIGLNFVDCRFFPGDARKFNIFTGNSWLIVGLLGKPWARSTSSRFPIVIPAWRTISEKCSISNINNTRWFKLYAYFGLSYKSWIECKFICSLVAVIKTDMKSTYSVKTTLARIKFWRFTYCLSSKAFIFELFGQL